MLNVKAPLTDRRPFPEPAHDDGADFFIAALIVGLLLAAIVAGGLAFMGMFL